MAISSAKPTRSISLPSRLHPNSEKIESQLNKLKTCWESRETPLGIEAIQTGLADLVQLYSSTNELIQSPLKQPSISSRKTVEEALDASIAIIDACGAARDLLLRTKESVRSLQSSLRRKAIGDSSVESDVNAYMAFRKTAKRDIAKSLRALKTMQSRVQDLPYSLHVEERSLQAVMRELSNVAVSVFKGLFVFLSVPVTKTKASGWALISKFVPVIGSINSERSSEHKIFNQVESVDFCIMSLQGQMRKSNNSKNIVGVVAMLQKRLKGLDGYVDGLESGLDCLFRCLIQHRVSLLNLITIC